MKLVKYLMPLLMAAGITTANLHAQVVGQETAFDRELRDRDDTPVREFVESKENIDVREKASNLEISGEVRFEWANINEKGIVLFTDSKSSGSSGSAVVEGTSIHEQYRGLRGGHYVDINGIPVSHNDFDVEFNLKFKYTFKDAWCMANLVFDNPAGIRGKRDCFGDCVIFNKDGTKIEESVERDLRLTLKGSGDSVFINLKRAYIGYNIYANGKKRLDIEIGRRKLDDVFDSEVQFTSRFDGILIKYASEIEKSFDWYFSAAAFVIDETVNHFGYVGEVGLINIYDTGVDIRYNFIDWKKIGYNRCFAHNPYGTRFLNSQISCDYYFTKKLFGRDMLYDLYGGFLINHAAKKSIFTKNKIKNLAWYVGLTIGNVHKQYDWSLDIEYIVVQAQAVPDFDVGSIGRGNILDQLLTDIVDARVSGVYESSIPSSYVSESSHPSELGYFPRRGNSNFAGMRAEFLYAITDNLSLDVIYEFSNEEDKKIGGPHYFSYFEMEAIYAF